MPKGDSTGHNRLVLSFCAKAEVRSFEGRVGMRLSDCILCVSLYYNLPDLFHRNAGSERSPGRAGTLKAPVHPGRR